MAYVVPTPADLKARFPGKFDALDDTYIQLIIDEAAKQVDDSWLEQDYATAILYLTAHLITMEQGSSADRPGIIQSESWGPMSISYAVSPGSMDELDATTYGRRFKYLRDRNFPAILVV